MKVHPDDGLTTAYRAILRDTLARYPRVGRAVLFGSRAMGTFSRASDIDLALEGQGLNQRVLSRIANELDESNLPYKVDLIVLDAVDHPPLIEHLNRHGYTFYRAGGSAALSIDPAFTACR